MAIVEFIYSWYNPRNPKCRNCEHWGGSQETYYGNCNNEHAKIKPWNRSRAHNAKACREFSLIREDNG
jgi:hypothetical protein